MAREIEVELVKVVIHERQDQQMIHLSEKGGTRSFPIVIGRNEALEIHRKLMGIKPQRPLTHDLLAATIGATGSMVDRVVVSDLRNGTFFATIHLLLPNGEPREVDSRPSDGIALATQVGCPLFVDEDVFPQLAQEGG